MVGSAPIKEKLAGVPWAVTIWLPQRRFLPSVHVGRLHGAVEGRQGAAEASAAAAEPDSPGGAVAAEARAHPGSGEGDPNWLV